MITISLCMIVKNEEAVLARCLNSVRDVVDEIIIADTGSTDSTKAIAGRYTDKVFDWVWCDDFSAARNAAYERATMDYQMWLDADDVLTPENHEKLAALKRDLAPEVDLVTMKYHTHYGADGNPILTTTRERLTRTEKAYRWIDPVHECIPLSGNILHADIAISHQKPPGGGAASTRNLDIYTALEASGARMTPRQRYYYARELKDHGSYAKACYYFESFLEEGQGWYEDNIAACYNLCVCYKALGSAQRILPVLFRSFQYDGPRAEICGEVGYYYKVKGNYRVALSWFRIALSLDRSQALGFVLEDYWGYIPNIECCVCCYELGDYERARDYNEQAALYKPDNAAVLRNRALLEGCQGPAKVD